MRKLLILGAGGYGRPVADVARQLGIYDKIGFLDDGRTGPEVLGACEEYPLFCDENTEVYPAFGNNSVRSQWLERFLEEDIPVATLVHPSAYVSPTAKLGQGVVVLPMAAVNTGCMVEDGCILNIGALVDHDCVLERCVHLCPGVIVKAENRIPAGAKIESGTVILNRNYPL